MSEAQEEACKITQEKLVFHLLKSEHIQSWFRLPVLQSATGSLLVDITSKTPSSRWAVRATLRCPELRNSDFQFRLTAAATPSAPTAPTGGVWGYRWGGGGVDPPRLSGSEHQRAIDVDCQAGSPGGAAATAGAEEKSRFREAPAAAAYQPRATSPKSVAIVAAAEELSV